MKKKISKNQKVIQYYKDCGADSSKLNTFLWKMRAFPSQIYQFYRIHETKQIIKKFKVKGKVLDAPCGSGYMLDIYSKGSIGVDINPRHVSAAKNRKKGVNAIVADMENLPFKKSSFDAIICAEIFEHIPDQQPMIKEMWRVLKKNGLFIATAPADTFLWKVRYLASSMYATEPQCVTFTETSMLNLFKKYRFKKIHMQKIAWGLNYLLILKKQ